jgi:hypothetical protein
MTFCVKKQTPHSFVYHCCNSNCSNWTIALTLSLLVKPPLSHVTSSNVRKTLKKHLATTAVLYCADVYICTTSSSHFDAPVVLSCRVKKSCLGNEYTTTEDSHIFFCGLKIIPSHTVSGFFVYNFFEVGQVVIIHERI